MEYFSNDQLKLAFDFVQYTNKNIFLTGKAGTGKTTFLKNLKKVSPKRMVVVAPTGVAAINAGGVTIHSFFQMPFGPFIPENQGEMLKTGQFKERDLRRMGKEKIAIIRTIDLLIIDEISMVRADLLDGVDEVLRRYRANDLPFGGIQLLMIGDLQQLAPIVREDDWEILKRYYNTCFFFSSKALQKTNFISIELKHIFRQSDTHFIHILNKVRDNNIDQETIEELNKRYIAGFSKEEHEGYITLTTHNAQAQEINDHRLKKLSGKAFRFRATVKGEFPEYSYPTEYELELKKGAQVMFVKNDISWEKLYFNGKIGRIEDFNDEIIYVQCPGEESAIPVSRQIWENTRYTLNEETKEITETIIGSFIQYPIKLAWAITIHKSQGLTFEKAIIDANAAFAHGQVYVALSRCKTLEGMVLSTPITYRCIKNDPSVSGFTKQIDDNQPNEQQLLESKAAYQKQLLNELFDFRPVQKNIFYLLKLIKDNESSLLGNLKEIVGKMNGDFKTGIEEVSVKFSSQIKALLQQNALAEENETLQERLKKAGIYFSEKMESIVILPLENISIETDNKEVKNNFLDVIKKLEEAAYLKIACLKSVTEGFYIKKYLNERAKALLEEPKRKTLKEFARKQVINDNIAHPVLYNRLKYWRNEKADELGLPLYTILPQKAILELVSCLPVSVKYLAGIKGLGKKRIKKYGKEIMQIVNQYRHENKMEVIEEKEIETEQKRIKKIKSDTKKVSYEMFRSGLKIEEIAHERNMAVETIENHLAHFVLIGEIEIDELVLPEKTAIITDCFKRTGSKFLAPAKEELGDFVTYRDLRFVQKYLEYKGIFNL